MKKRFIAVAGLLSIAAYLLPFVASTNAGGAGQAAGAASTVKPGIIQLAAVANAASEATAPKKAVAVQTASVSSAAAATMTVDGVKSVDLRITAYASVPDETDNTPFLTANGTYVHDGIVASNLFPFGTEIMIPSLYGNKIFTVEDRMAPYFKQSVDIWMPSVTQAIDFGVHHVQVVIIPPTGALTDIATTSVANADDTLAMAK